MGAMGVRSGDIFRAGGAVGRGGSKGVLAGIGQGTCFRAASASGETGTNRTPRALSSSRYPIAASSK
ncbi:hypothetical protein SBV1_440017 [Verrucomicrobia bacterium]|nr:hypothetical protein SBV1_440017 [Verrucomicrobiota bacterium]